MPETNTKQIVKTLIQKRQMEAIKKQIGEKLVVIAQNFGKPVVSSGYRPTNPSYWTEKDGFYTENFNEIETIEEDEDWNEYEMGWYFDGLRFGVNLSVLVLVMEERIVEIKATYNSYVVFAEIEGKIKAYAPFKEWEEPMENIFVGADMADKRRKGREKEDSKEEKKGKLDELWRLMKMLWGA